MQLELASLFPNRITLKTSITFLLSSVVIWKKTLGNTIKPNSEVNGSNILS